MIKRLDDKVELYKLHVKHYHMSPTQFRRRTSMLNLPDRIYEKYEDVFNKCRVCSMSVAPPREPRSLAYEPQFSEMSFLLIIVKSS